jgi:TRAP-type C4-dicarboxylate transport system permease small subunit
MNRNTSMIITIVLALLCSCCSLFMCIMGFGGITGNGTFNFGGPDQPMPPAAGYALLCVSVILILVPIVTGFLLLRKKPEALASDEPLPPVS